MRYCESSQVRVGPWLVRVLISGHSSSSWLWLLWIDICGAFLEAWRHCWSIIDLITYYTIVLVLYFKAKAAHILSTSVKVIGWYEFGSNCIYRVCILIFYSRVLVGCTSLQNMKMMMHFIPLEPSSLMHCTTINNKKAFNDWSLVHDSWGTTTLVLVLLWTVGGHWHWNQSHFWGFSPILLLLFLLYFIQYYA